MFSKSFKALKHFVVGIIKCQLATPVVLVFLITPTVTGQTTAFNYQGRLTDGGVPPTGNYDIRFQLYDALTGGNVICGAQGSPNVSVVNGTFTLQLDFGSEACFPFGSNRYLEVAVRPTGSPNPHTVLSPRQQLLSAPYSMKSLKAQDANNATNSQLATNALSLGGFGASLYLRTNGDGSALTNLNAGSITSGTLSDARLSSNIARLDTANQTFTGNTIFGGNVGIGISTPLSKLHILSGASNLPPRLQSSGNTGFAAGWDFYWVNTGKGYVGVPDPSSSLAPGEMLVFGGAGTETSLWAGGARAITIYTDGRVGIGGPHFPPPLAKLHVVEDSFTAIRASNQDPFGFAVFSDGNSKVVGELDVIGNVIFDGDLDLNGFLELQELGSAGSQQLCRGGNNLISFCSSSLRYKRDVNPFDDGLSLIEQLRPIAFKWKSNDAPDIGFGAEDVAKINPLFVTYNAKGEIEGVKYDRLSVVFVNAFKEQQALIERQQQQINALTRLVCRSKPRADLCKRRK